MGFSLSWVAVRNGTEEAVYRTLGFTKSGRDEEFPRSTFCGSLLSTGWILVIWNRHLAAMDGTVDLGALSTDNDVVACMVEEHVGCSAAANWSLGAEIWSLSHDGEKGIG